MLTKNTTPRHSGVSIIIPLYNKQLTIARAIRSALQQDTVLKEVVVVDDGSTDDSKKEVDIFGDAVIYVRQENKGPSSARNLGVSISRYDLLVFLDADDELADGCLTTHIKCRQNFPQCQISYVGFNVIGENNIIQTESIAKRVMEQLKENSGCYLYHGFNQKLVFNVASGSICIDKSLFNKVGGYDEALVCWEITDFMLRTAVKLPHICISDFVGLSIHVDSHSSQFEKTKYDDRQIALFGHKILDVVSDVPVNERQALYVKIQNILYFLINNHNFDEFKEIFKHSYKLKLNLHASRKYYLLSVLPNWSLRILYYLHFVVTRKKIMRH